jgi:hypothetical protein
MLPAAEPPGLTLLTKVSVSAMAVPLLVPGTGWHEVPTKSTNICWYLMVLRENRCYKKKPATLGVVRVPRRFEVS